MLPAAGDPPAGRLSQHTIVCLLIYFLSLLHTYPLFRLPLARPFSLSLSLAGAIISAAAAARHQTDCTVWILKGPGPTLILRRHNDLGDTN